MTQVIFRSEAEADLRSIIAYYDEVAPHALGNILADIHHAIDRLTAFPPMGMQMPGRAFRRIVTLRYHFKIAYVVSADGIVVVGIFRYQNRDA